jgi:hypothetical protein
MEEANVRPDDDTALYIACQKRHLELVKYLISLDVNIYKAYNYGFTPLKNGLQIFYFDIIKLLFYYDGSIYLSLIVSISFSLLLNYFNANYSSRYVYII